MEIEWDETKRQLVLAKHGLDFRDVGKILDLPHVLLTARSDAETRLLAVGLVGDRMVAVVFTLRGDRVRLITARRARDNECRAYRQVHG